MSNGDEKYSFKKYFIYQVNCLCLNSSGNSFFAHVSSRSAWKVVSRIKKGKQILTNHVACFLAAQAVLPPQSMTALLPFFFLSTWNHHAFFPKNLSLLPELRFGFENVSMLGQNQQQLLAFEAFCHHFETLVWCIIYSLKMKGNKVCIYLCFKAGQAHRGIFGLLPPYRYVQVTGMVSLIPRI